jgi:DNA-binding NarL/FixJ family response regulator
MNVLIADDQENVRSALRFALGHEHNMRVVGEVDDIDNLVSALERTRPNLLIIDWELLNGDADAFLESLRELFPDLYILAMCSRCGIGQFTTDEETYDLVSKSESPGQLLTKLRAINQSIVESSDKILQ